MQKTTTFLMFVGDQYGKAEEAIHFYVSLFKQAKIHHIERYGKGDEEPEGTVKRATFTIGGQEYMAMDSNAPHPFTFTPAISIFVSCDTEKEIAGLYEKLSEQGSVLMELANYGSSKKFAWVQDRYGVSWQLSVAT